MMAKRKTTHRPVRRRSKPRAQLENIGLARNVIQAAGDGAVAAFAPWSTMSNEVYGLARKRLGRIVEASCKLMAARSVDDAMSAQSEYVARLMSDYAESATRIGQTCTVAGTNMAKLPTAQQPTTTGWSS
jgi:hypothetical protein